MSRNTSPTALPTSAEMQASHPKTPGNYTISPALPEHRQGVPLHEMLPKIDEDNKAHMKEQAGRNNVTMLTSAVFVGTFAYLIFAHKKPSHVMGSGAMNAMSNNAMASRVNGLIAVIGAFAGITAISALLKKGSASKQ